MLLPTGRCILMPATASGLLVGAIGVSGFPSLNNLGDNIIVKNSSGLIVDSISYSQAWYKSEEKKDGGWSLEIIDPENLCEEEGNWTASTNASGGTPNLQNSVLASRTDTSPPFIDLIRIISPTKLEVSFNEKLAGHSMPFASSVPPIDFSSIAYSSSLRKIILNANAALQASTPYLLTLSNIFDCPGNAMVQKTIQIILPEAAAPSDILINEILFNPKTGGVDFLEVFNASNKHINLKKWSIANRVDEMVSNAKTIGTQNLVLAPQSFLAFTTDPTILKSHYPKAIESQCMVATLPPMPDTQGTVAILDSLGMVIDHFIYRNSYHQKSLSDKDGVSLERIAIQIQTNDSTNWQSGSKGEDFATPGYKNSASYPAISSISVNGLNSLLINFSEPLNPTSAQASSNFTVNNNVGHPSTAFYQLSNKSVVLNFSVPLTNGATYALRISGIIGLDGDVMETGTFDFLYFIPQPVHFKDIIVSEFMVDPVPVVGLPESEYVELFNRSNNPVDLQAWTFSDGNTASVLPKYILMPKTRCVLVASSTVRLFPGAIGVANFPSLNNSGDNLILKNPKGLLIDSITFSEAWYRSDDKKDGGWSLEIIDPENLCEEEGNWSASENANGGTPGSMNSVFASNPDITAPFMVSAIALSSTKLEITFNEKLDVSASASALSVPNVNFSFHSFSPSRRKIILNAASPFLSSVLYTLTLSSVFDCPGNPLAKNTINFVLPEKAAPNELLISEILFNPKTGGVDFLEVFNNSAKFVNLENWSLANWTEGAISNSKTIEPHNLLIAPKSFLVFTPQPMLLKAHYPRTVESVCWATTLPSMPDDQGSIALVDSLGDVIDYFLYNDNYHVVFLKDKQGVSLERVSMQSPTNDSDNWRSASQSENFATPGYRNSAFTDGSAAAAGEILIDPEIFSPQVAPNDFTTINYRFDQSGFVANASILDHQGHLIRTLANNEVLGTEGFFRWDGEREDGGRARAGYYIALVEVFGENGQVNIFRKRVVVAFR